MGKGTRRQLALVVLLSAAALAAPKILKRTGGGGWAEEPADYDRYLFATEWVGTACRFKSCKHHINAGRFNVHGLWPSTEGDSPQNCDELYFDESNLSPFLKQNLYDYWNGCYTDNWDFVKYELKKHGTCWNIGLGDQAAMDQGITRILKSFNPSDEFSDLNTYMTLVVFLSRKFDPFRVLQGASIVPGDDKGYMIQDFLKVFNASFGLSTAVIPVCLREKSSGEDFISELRFCLDLNYAPMDCDPVTVQRHVQNCGSDPVLYPRFSSPAN